MLRSRAISLLIHGLEQAISITVHISPGHNEQKQFRKAKQYPVNVKIILLAEMF